MSLLCYFTWTLCSLWDQYRSCLSLWFVPMQICHLLRLSSLSLWLILLLSFLTEIYQLDHCLILIAWRFELLPHLFYSNFALCLDGSNLLSFFNFCRSKKPWEVWRSRSHTEEICAENIVFLASLHKQQESYRMCVLPCWYELIA